MFDKNNENYKLYLAGIISESEYYDLCDDKPVNEVSDDGNDMIMSTLSSIIDHAQMLKNSVKPDSQLDEWMESKLAVCRAYLQDVAHAFKYDQEKSMGSCGIPVADMGAESMELKPIADLYQTMR